MREGERRASGRLTESPLQLLEFESASERLTESPLHLLEFADKRGRVTGSLLQGFHFGESYGSSGWNWYFGSRCCRRRMGMICRQVPMTPFVGSGVSALMSRCSSGRL